jgi:subtilisin family serine protease
MTNSRALILKLFAATLAAACAAALAPGRASSAGPAPLARESSPAGRGHARAPRVEGELLVKLDKRAARGAVAAAHARAGALVVAEYERGWQQLKLPRGIAVEDALALYAGAPGVEAAQPNYVYRVSDATPDDPRFAELYGMAKISAPAAWGSSTGSRSVVVAVIDTGVRYTHEDLQPNVWTNPGETGTDAEGRDRATNGVDDDSDGFVDDARGWDFANSDADPADDNGHGTHCAGTVGAAGNNSKGVAGVNWQVSLLPVKTHDPAGNSTSAKVVAAFNYVTLLRSRGVNLRVTSNSWGGAPEAAAYDPALEEAIRAAGDAGILNVFAAGNDNTNTDSQPFYPASYNVPNVVSVAASDQNDNRASFSNYGAASVDLAAPGVSILSTTFGGPADYGAKSGTSMAAPHVAGAAALLAAHNPSLDAASLKATLLNSVDVLPQWSASGATPAKVRTGGRLNVARALQSPTACSYPLSPVGTGLPAGGGGGSFGAQTQPNCDWSAGTDASWITITSGARQSGAGSVSYTVAPNGGPARVGHITAGGQTFIVAQEAAPQQSAAGGQILISEFRIDGPAGAADEFFELYNATDAPVTVAAADNSAGWSLAAWLKSGGATFTYVACTIPNGVRIPARGHYLCANSFTDNSGAQRGYSLADYGGTNRAAPDRTTSGPGLTADGASFVLTGLGLFRSTLAFNAGNRLDAVGTAAGGDPLAAEGQPISYGGEYHAAAQYSWVRKVRNGQPQDTGDSASDFVLVSASAATLGGVASVLGAPGPENTTSPVRRDAEFPAAPFDPKCEAYAPANACQNRVRDAAAPGAAYGTLAVRRRYQNLTGATVTRLRFRVTEITTLHAPTPSGQAADLRVLSSPDVTLTTSAGQTVTVKGTTVETPPAQPLGGGLNSSLSVELPPGGLAPGATLDVQFLLGVERPGKLRFVVSVEAQ